MLTRVSDLYPLVSIYTIVGVDTVLPVYDFDARGNLVQSDTYRIRVEAWGLERGEDDGG